tara:strand:- start:1211 stop:1453 length:243 start_codon:yes stop_codon:yes gene_type:complete
MVTKLTYKEALALFWNEVPVAYTKVACPDSSSLRLGGWLLKDKRNMMIGFVGHRGDVRWHDYRDVAVGETPVAAKEKVIV